MSRCRDPVLVEHRAAAAMGAGEAEERGASHRHLPRPSTERRVLAADDPRFRSREQRRHAALHAFALCRRGDRRHGARLRGRLNIGSRIGFRSGGRGGRGCGCGRSRGGTGRGACSRGGRCGLLRRPRPCGRLEVGRRYVVCRAERLVELGALPKGVRNQIDVLCFKAPV